MPAPKHDYARPISRGASVGFGFLVVGLSALTFCITIWGVDFSTELQAKEAIASVKTAVPKPERAARRAFVLEPKTLGRLPVFGGLKASGQ